MNASAPSDSPSRSNDHAGIRTPGIAAPAGASLLPNAGTELQPGDHVSVLISGDRPETTHEVVRLCTGL